MAEVYRGQITGVEGFARPVAIKRVLPHVSADKLFAKMFINEARISSMLNHPNVVSVIDFDRDAQECLFLVMELVEGRDLSDVLAEGGLSFPVIIHVLVEALRGLGYAHELVHEGKHLGIVHRDVSPHNVLVSWEGAVKVSDFGIAKAAAASDATRSGMLKGKVAYMSPEQANGQQLDGRSDLFAAGVMLYLMLTSQPPFTGSAIGEVIAQILTRPVPPPRELRPDVPADLDAITMRLLEKKREHRYANAREVVDALLGCQDASPRGADLLAEVMRERYPNDAPLRPTPASSAATVQHVVAAPAPAASAPPAEDRPPAAAASGGTMPLPNSVAGPATPAATPVAPDTKTGKGRSRLLYAVALIAALGIVGGIGLAITRDGGATHQEDSAAGHAQDASTASRADEGSQSLPASGGDLSRAGPGSRPDAGAAAKLTRDLRDGGSSAKPKPGGKRRPGGAPRKDQPGADWDIEIGKPSPHDLPVREGSP
jgi:serine/threonine-protein kinase